MLSVERNPVLARDLLEAPSEISVTRWRTFGTKRFGSLPKQKCTGRSLLCITYRPVMAPTVAALATGASSLISLLKPVAVTVAVLALAFETAVGLVTPQPVAHADEKPAVKAEKKTNRTPKPFAWNFARQKMRE